MEFRSNRCVNFSIMVGGQRFIVMFSEQNQNGQSAFFTEDDMKAEAIRRHPFCKKGIVWEVGTTPSDSPKGEEKAESGKLEAESGKLKAESVKANDEGLKDEGEEDHAFSNFTEAKEWFCKTYGVAKNTVRNPTALQRAAKEKGVVITIQ